MSSSVGINNIMLLFVLKLFFYIMKPMFCCYYFSAFCFLNTIAPIYHRRYAIFLSCSSFLFHSRYCFIFLFLSEWSKISFDLFIYFFIVLCYAFLFFSCLSYQILKSIYYYAKFRFGSVPHFNLL